MTFRYVTYEPEPDGRIVRITLDRPQTRNAQSRGLLVELDEAFAQAEQDDEVRVVVLGRSSRLGMTLAHPQTWPSARRARDSTLRTP
jgi:enoyl-CoA hydratase